MPILVQKYGGSSVGAIEKLQAVARKIAATRRAGYDLVVVVSAMGDTTDELLAMARAIAESPSRRELDMLLSVGERISMALLSMAIQEHGIEATSLTGSQCGILTTDSHSNARIMDVRPFRVQDELDKGRVVIVAGYQGTSYRREVTTLGRGGSDTTAVALAAALGAEACEIYSDVDGVFSGDPRVILSARQLIELRHEEMLEMARSGARVLNEQAVEFARRAGIALYARSAHDDGSRGTVIRPDGFEERAQRAERGLPAVAVSHLDRGLHITAKTSADAVLARISDLDVVVCHWECGRGCGVFLDTENIHDLPALRAELSAIGDDVALQTRGLVSLIGHGIGGRPRWSLDAVARLEAEAISPHGVTVSVGRLSFVVDSAQVGPAANALHEAFIA